MQERVATSEAGDNWHRAKRIDLDQGKELALLR
jgi:hypothetical protein